MNGANNGTGIAFRHQDVPGNGLKGLDIAAEGNSLGKNHKKILPCKGNPNKPIFIDMPQSLHALNVHIVFSTKGRHPWIISEIRPRLWAYMSQIP